MEAWKVSGLASESIMCLPYAEAYGEDLGKFICWNQTFVGFVCHWAASKSEALYTHSSKLQMLAWLS